MLARSSALLASERSIAVSILVCVCVVRRTRRIDELREETRRVQRIEVVATPELEWKLECFSNRCGASVWPSSSSSWPTASALSFEKHPAGHLWTTRPAVSPLPDILPTPENEIRS
jgi:hypothetical protein